MVRKKCDWYPGSVRLWSLLILLGALAVLTYIILYNGGMALEKMNSVEVIQKLKDIQAKGGEFELTQKDINAQEQKRIKRVGLIKVKNELINVYSQVVTSSEQKLISKMSSTLSKLISNPSYNYTTDKASIMHIYGTLDSTSRDRVKSALFWNIDGDSITQLRQTFGL